MILLGTQMKTYYFFLMLTTSGVSNLAIKLEYSEKSLGH